MKDGSGCFYTNLESSEELILVVDFVPHDELGESLVEAFVS